MAHFDLTTIGEGNLRLSVPAGNSLERATRLDVAIAGSEGNVAGTLASLGRRCGWVSRLPESPLGRRVVREYRGAGVDTSAVVWCRDRRLATLFVEYGARPRSTQVIFDRDDSAFSAMTVEDIDWEYLLDTRLIHLTGITAALSESVRAILGELTARARQAGIPISFDVNYRERLWSTEAASTALAALIGEVDLLFCSETDARRVFDCRGSPDEVLRGLARLTGARQIVMSRSRDGLLARDGERSLAVPASRVDIIDRIGAGDGLAAGVLHGYLQGDFERGLHYGSIVAALAMGRFGEMVSTSQEELDALGDGSPGGIVR